MKRSEILLSLKERIEESYDGFMSTIRQFFRNLSRSIAFAKIGWNNYDWDYGYLFELMLFKLERMEKAILNGYAEPNKKTNQSIRICIKLLRKLKFKDYMYFTEQHYAKWGQPEMVFNEINKDGDNNPHAGSTLEIRHENAVTEEQKEQQRLEFLEAYRKDEEQEQRDAKLLFNIMLKYHRYWWD